MLFCLNFICSSVRNWPVIGIVTQIDRQDTNLERAYRWLKLAGYNPIFYVGAYSDEKSGLSSSISVSPETYCHGEIIVW